MQAFMQRRTSVFAVEIEEEVFVMDGQAFDGYDELRDYFLVKHTGKLLHIAFSGSADEGVKQYWKGRKHVQDKIKKAKKRKKDKEDEANGNGGGNGGAGGSGGGRP